ncbi:MAG: Vps62-related protein [Candidatus Babeliales bacterium]|nr:Vps62-related protein [Candidatus Babeliales bacterium]
MNIKKIVIIAGIILINLPICVNGDWVDVTPVVRSLNNQSFIANNDTLVPRDPAPGVAKQLLIENRKRFDENSNVVNPFPVVSARYGSDNYYLPGQNFFNRKKSSKWIDVTGAVKGFGHNPIPVNNDTFGKDPVPGVPKQLEITTIWEYKENSPVPAQEDVVLAKYGAGKNDYIIHNADDCVKMAGVDAMGGNIKASLGIPPCNVIDVSDIVADEIYSNRGDSNPIFPKVSAPGQEKTLTITVKLGSCAPFTWEVKEGESLWSKRAMDAWHWSADGSQNPGATNRNVKFATQVFLGVGCGLAADDQECTSSNQCRGNCHNGEHCSGNGDYPNEKCCSWAAPVDPLSHSKNYNLLSNIQGVAGAVGGALLTADLAMGNVILAVGNTVVNEITHPKELLEGIERGINDALPLIESVVAESIILEKDWVQTIYNEAKTVGYLAKDVVTNDESDLNKNLRQAGDVIKSFGIQTAGGSVKVVHDTVAVIKDMLDNPQKIEYCPFSYTSKHSNMPKTVDDPSVRAQDYEGLIDDIIKYAPTSFLFRAETKGLLKTVTVDELYQPMWADEYFTSPTSRFKVGSTGKEYLKGKVTFEKMYELHTKCTPKNEDLYIENDPCAKYGSAPDANIQNGVLTTPLYVVTSEANGKIYIEYIYFYGFNGPFDIGPFQGASEKTLEDLRDLHESDIEHISVELDKNTKKLTRVYFGSHGSTEGFWLNANSPDIEWDGTHPVAYVAKNSHGIYPKVGTYVRIFGMANDITARGQMWKAKLIRMYRKNDPRFDPKTMGWLYFSGKLGAHGIDSTNEKPWFTEGPQVGDIGRDPNASPRHCDNPSGGWEGAFDDVNYVNCIQGYAPQATIPD